MDDKKKLDKACDELRKVIRNQKQEVDYRKAWIEMSLTSSIKRNKEIRNILWKLKI